MIIVILGRMESCKSSNELSGELNIHNRILIENFRKEILILLEK